MPIEPGFQVRLGIYGIDADVVRLRADLWRLLAPNLHDLLEAYLENVFEVAPFYRKKMQASRAAYIGTAKFYIERLFNSPFDEQWVQDAYDRAAAEITAGLDMRNRAASTVALLGGLNPCIAKAHRFSPRKGYRLLDAGTRIFMLDAANAVACHNSAQVEQAKARTEALENTIKDFGGAVEGVRGTVANVVSSIGSTSDQLAALAKVASDQMGTAIRAAADTAARIGSIATATDELTASIDEIHARTTGSVQLAQQAVSDSVLAAANIRSLSETVGKIGSVVNLISEIAGQTNLLALNATIEAARAGDAGKGFGVVASGVKSLAVQTAKATDDVGKQIAIVQDAMHRSMREIASSNQSISEISNVSGSLAGMVTEQAHATSEIAKSANSASLNATTVTDALRTMEETIRCTQDATNVVLGFVGELSTRAAEVGAAMDGLFKAAQGAGVKEFANLARSSRR